MSESFEVLGLPAALLENLHQLGYKEMTPIQAAALPLVLQGRDLVAQAKTGSGKTAAFSLGMLLQLNPRFFGVQGLVLCPTRELSTQVAADIRRFARYQQNIKVVCLTGGAPLGPQIATLAQGAHIVVGTPGRIIDHLEKNTLDIRQLKTLVLDEADRMLDMGFVEPIRQILRQTPKSRQTLLFSATFPDAIERLSAEFTRNAQSVVIETTPEGSSIEQIFLPVKAQDKLALLPKVIAHYRLESAVIFCNTKVEVERVCESLNQQGLAAEALHGDCEQRDRDQRVIQFKHQSLRYLVATDVAARGLDIEDLPGVINFDLTRDPEVYVHRIGRTGRAGKSGVAVSFCADTETYLFERIAQFLQAEHPALAGGALLAALPIWQPKKIPAPSHVTVCINAGRKEKIRPGDILGALTAGGQLAAAQVGKIDITEFSAFVAVARSQAALACDILNGGKIKGRSYKAKML